MKRFLYIIISLIVLSGAIFALTVIKEIRSLPDPEAFEARQIAQSTKIYDRTGKVLLYEVYGEEKRTVIPFSEIPEYVKQATIAIEDAEFYSHPAFDWRGIIRAFLVNLRSGQIVQGGSTITQQLAKNAFLSSERTLVRKIKELVLSFRLEKKYTKDQILDLYLNQIPYGTNAYGVEAAAQTFFNKSAKDLTLAEAALLASLPKAPSYYSPSGTHIDELMRRKNLVLERMQTLHFITAEEKIKAQKTTLTFAPLAHGLLAPHFVMTVQDYLNSRYGEDFVRTAGLHIITTLDWDLQQLAEKVVAEGAARNTELYQGKNAALVAQDATTGQIMALVGSKDYFNTKDEGNFNVAVQGLRQPGSAIKPFAYAAAFKKGYTPDTVLFDLETEFDTSNQPEKSYKPQNFDEQFRGPVTMREGLAQSINIPSVKTLYLAGISNTLNLAAQFGITTLNERNRYGLSLALGGGEVKLIELVGAYSVLSQDGVKHRQALILKIEDKDGKVIEEYSDKKEQVIESQYTRLVNDILADRDARRPLFQNSLSLTTFADRDVALKTGTSNDYRDAWTIGYTPSLVVGVWAGNNDNQPMQRKGGSILAAVPIWHSFMIEALAKYPSSETFPRPEPIITEKPILNGQYLVNNQVHDILYYVDRDDPQGPPPANPSSDAQFENWEKPITDWIRQHPEKLIADSASGTLHLEIISPQNGSFITTPIPITLQIQSQTAIDKIELYFNGTLLEQKKDNFGTTLTYSTTINPVLDLQNSLQVKIFSAGQSAEKQIILFKR